MAENGRTQAIAIVGLAGRFPGGGRLDDFWRTIRDGVEVLTQLSDADLDAARVDPAVRADPRYVRAATLLADADQFDAGFFGVSPREAQILDPQQRVFLETAWEALEHAGHAGSTGQAVGVYAGVGMNTYLLNQLLGNPAFCASVGGYQVMVGSDKDFLATRVSYKLDLRGPSMTVQTACSTSLVAVIMACRALQRGECDLALAGGVAILFPQGAGYLYEEGMIFSPDARCRPFDAQAKGTRGSSGAGVVVLRRLADALADGDQIHAVILGGALNNDGAAKAGYTAPSVEGQVEVIATAQALAGVDPRTVGYVEAHGTGTPLGDPIEIAALTQAFRAATPDVGFCRLGSLKANLGHLDAAAGVASLIKTVLCLEHRELPPLVNFTRPNPQLALETTPFTASAEGAPWPAPTGTPRRAGVSSFGIGGTNAHVVVEEAPPPAGRAAETGPHLLVLSARTPAALDRQSADLAAHLRAHPDAPLGDVAWTLQAGRRAFPHRRAVVARGAADAADALASPQRPPAITGTFEGEARPVAFLFSGQGSQHLRMGAGLHRTEPVYRAAFDRCAELLAPDLGLDLRAAVLGDGPAAALDETRLTQPALFAVEYALATLWASRGVRPAAMLGHSIGEYVAAHLAGVLSLEDALKVVAARGRLMQALPAGSMAAVPLGEADLARYLVESGGVEIAARNAPGLCTVSGPKDAVARLVARLTAAGIEARPLHTSHAFHSAMMEPALGPFEAVVREVTLSAPRIPYPSNVSGTWITAAQATSPAYYAEHLRRAVRFEEGVRLLAADPAALLLEVGPGNALTSLARLTVGKDGARRVLPSLPHPREGRADEEAALEAAGRLWLAGAALDWKGLHAAGSPRRVPLPTYPFERKRHWVDVAPAAARRAEPAARGGAAAAARVDDWFHVPTWARQDPAPGALRLAGEWLVIGAAGPLRDAVAREVTAAGASAVVAEAAAQLGRDAAGAIDLRTLPGCAPAGQDPLARSYHALVALAEKAQGRPFRIVVATRGAQSVLDERVQDLDALLVTGPVLSLPTEVPGLRMRAVDLDPGRAGELDAAARALVEEAALDDGGALVARRGGRRWVRRHEATRLPPVDAAALPLKPRGVYLVTGGLGGIGLTLARWLAERAQARLLLTARTPLPPRDAWPARIAANDAQAATLRSLLEVEGAGGEVLVHAADAADAAAMRAAVDAALARWGTLDGVVHAAGWSGDNRLAFLKQPADVARVLSAKRDGLRVLAAVLGDRPLDLVVLMSTISSVIGMPGLADYAAANAVLDGFPESTERPAPWKRVVALSYAPWRDVGMAARIERRGVEEENFQVWALPTDPALDAFGRGLASGRARVAVVKFAPDAIRLDLRGEEELRVVAAEARAQEATTAQPVAGTQRPAVAAGYAAPESDAERELAAIWSELLGVEKIGVDDDFFELGGHSLLATRILARVDQALHVRLTLRDVFEAPTIRKLAARIGAAPPPAPAAADGDREEIEF
jgi:acyl transferase domain-containing protein/acyl carrier protein